MGVVCLFLFGLEEKEVINLLSNYLLILCRASDGWVWEEAATASSSSMGIVSFIS